MYDLWMFFGIAIVGGFVALVGFLLILGKRAAIPSRDLQHRIDSLESEIKELKNKG